MILVTVIATKMLTTNVIGAVAQVLSNLSVIVKDILLIALEPAVELKVLTSAVSVTDQVLLPHTVTVMVTCQIAPEFAVVTK